MESECSHFEFNGYKILADSNEVLRDGKVIKLTPKEKQVFVFLYRNKGRAVSRAQILETVWGDSFGNDSGLTQAVSKLRKILNDNPKQPRVIKTIPKFGYQLLADTTSTSSVKKTTFNPFSINYRNLSRAKVFGINVILMLVILLIFLLIADVNIRIEQEPPL